MPRKYSGVVDEAKDGRLSALDLADRRPHELLDGLRTETNCRGASGISRACHRELARKRRPGERERMARNSGTVSGAVGKTVATFGCRRRPAAAQRGRNPCAARSRVLDGR